VVAQVGESSGRIYLNFDKDWRKDFTVLIERKDGEAFKAAGIDPLALAGKKFRVRGWAERADDSRDPRRADRAIARWRRLAAECSRGSGVGSAL
jgi:hypothetical protein